METQSTTWLDRPASRALRFNWEKALYISIFVLALVSRFWDLGVRAISHDESLHAYYAWKLYHGQGFQHSPLMHGPLRFHLDALTFGLFGADDFTARIPAAIFGVALVMAPILLRRWLGRRGALLTSFLFLISPTILYHQRYIRDEPFMILYGALMLWTVLSYARERSPKWLYLAAAITGFMYTTMESAFIYVAIFGAFAVLAGVFEVARDSGWGKGGVGGTLLGVGVAVGLMFVGLFIGARFLIGFLPELPQDGSPIGLMQMLPSLVFIALVGAIVGGGIYFAARALIPPAARRSAGFNLAIVLGSLSLFMSAAAALLILNHHLGPDYEMSDAQTGAKIAAVSSQQAVLLIGQSVDTLGLERNYDLRADVLDTKATIGVEPGLVATMRQAMAGRAVMTLHIEPAGNTIWGLISGANNQPYVASAFFNDGNFPTDPANVGNVLRLLFLVVCFGALAIGIGLWWDPTRWLVSAGVFGGIGVTFFTTIFTNGTGLGTGFVGSLGYWLVQQDVKRGGQPSGYYLFIGSIYEYLPMLLTLAAFAYFAWRYFTGRSLRLSHTENDLSQDWAAPLMMLWAALSWAAYSVAGEKMPWLIVHIATPMVVLGGRFLGEITDRIDWGVIVRRRGWLNLLLIPLLVGSILSIAGAVNAITASPGDAAAPTLTQLSAAGSLLSGVLLGGIALAGLIVLAARIGLAPMLQMSGVAAFGLLALSTIRTAYMYNYVNYDNVVEFGMYAHGGPGLKIALQQIEDISRRTTGTPNQIELLYDNGATWPWLWYLRDFPNARYVASTPTRSDASLPIMILSSDNWNTVDQAVGDSYDSFRFQRIWWPIEDYKRVQEIVCPAQLSRPDGSFARYAAYDENDDGQIDVTEQANGDARCRQHFLDLVPAMWNIFFFRDYTLYGQLTNQNFSPAEWPLREDFRLYVRKDIAAKVWNQAVGAVEVGGGMPEPVKSDPYQARWRDATAMATYGSAGQGPGQFLSPHGIALGPDGSIYVADSSNYRIVKLDANGKFVLAFGTWSGEPPNGDIFSPDWNPPSGTFYDPWGIAAGPDGSVYVADLGTSRIQKFDANGKFIKSWGRFGVSDGQASGAEGLFWGPRGIAVGKDGRVYVADTGNKRVQAFDSDGRFLFQFGGAGLLDGSLDEPVGVAVTDAGELIVADTWNGRIQVFSAKDGQALRRWNIDGWFDPNADDFGRNKVGKPYVAAGADGRVYVADQAGNRILIFDANGDYLAAFGRFGEDETSFAAPSGLAIDRAGNILLVDTGNNRIMVFPPLQE